MNKLGLKALIYEQVKKTLTEASFTKVHYIQIAKILQSAKTVKEVGEQLIAIFASDNPLFDEAKFRAAAGLHGNMTTKDYSYAKRPEKHTYTKAPLKT